MKRTKAPKPAIANPKVTINANLQKVYSLCSGLTKSVINPTIIIMNEKKNIEAETMLQGFLVLQNSRRWIENHTRGMHDINPIIKVIDIITSI
jgi:hypothetical protein